MDEDMRRTMQFILEQQAQLTVNQQKTEEQIAADRRETDGRLKLLEANMAELARAQKDLTLAQAELAQSQQHLSKVMAAMLDTHAHTEARLDAFIGLLERYMSERRNGRGEN